MENEDDGDDDEENDDTATAEWRTCRAGLGGSGAGYSSHCRGVNCPDETARAAAANCSDAPAGSESPPPRSRCQAAMCRCLLAASTRPSAWGQPADCERSGASCSRHGHKCPYHGCKCPYHGCKCPYHGYKRVKPSGLVKSGGVFRLSLKKKMLPDSP